MSSAPCRMSTGVRMRLAKEIGLTASCGCGPIPFHPVLPPSAASNWPFSPVAASMPQSMTPAPTSAARNLSVCPIAQAAMNPPWLAPAMPSRSGSATPSVTSRSMPVRMSVHSSRPTLPATLAANS